MGVTYSRETIRRELLAAGYVWKRAKLKGRDDDPQRARNLAQIRALIEQLRPSDAFFWVDELDIHLLAKVGYGLGYRQLIALTRNAKFIPSLKQTLTQGAFFGIGVIGT